MGYYDIIGSIMDDLISKAHQPQIKRKQKTKTRPVQKREYAKRNSESFLTLDQWDKIIKLQDNRCALCGEKFTKKNPATKDHIVPKAFEGKLIFENVQAAHLSCNSKKNNRIDKSNIVSWITRLDLCVNEMPY